MHNKRKPLVVITLLFALFPPAPALCGVSSTASSAGTTLELREFPIKGQTEGLEPEEFDFRYAPARWQACIGLPDDPHKSMLGSDGGLYYQYGAGSFHGFGTRIVADLETQGPKGKIDQSLRHPRIPIVITTQDIAGLTLKQHAWAGAPRADTVAEWAPHRVDYLWLEMANNSNAPRTGRIAVRIDSRTPLAISDDNTRLFQRGSPEKTFCTISPACTSFDPPNLAEHYLPGAGIETADPPAVNKGWANPKPPCDPRFRDIMVRNAGPLEFTYHAKPSKNYRLAFGLIEGWHSKPGIRPLEIRIEGKTVRTVDLIAEFGRNKPAVLFFDARDENADGLIQMSVHPPKDAEDNNTILSLLWVFDPADTPTEKQLIKGGHDNRALAVTFPGKAQRTIKLLFDEKTLAPGREYRALLTFHQGRLASARTPEDRAQQEIDRAVQYWQNADLPYDRITVPDPAIQALLDSCIRNIYQARELREGRPAFQVGPTCYRGTWAADGPFILESITYLGRAAETRAGLHVQIDKDEGPQGVKFSKKSGLRLWMVWRHAQLTGDFKWLEKTWPKVEQNVNNIIQYRNATRDDPKQANYGLMPPGFGDGGLGGVHREYTNVYWTLAGLKAAIQMAQKLDKSDTAAKWRAEYEDYWRAFDKARNRDKLTDKAGNIYVPVTMKGEQPQPPQRGAWAFMHSIFPGRIFEPDDSLMLGTMAMLDANQQEGLIYGTGWMHNGIWNYAASFYAHAHLWLGHSKKAAATLYAFANHACPLLCWREEQNPRGNPENYVGDMPHNWASAEFIRLIRHLLILERGRDLHLLPAMPAAWAKPGAKTQLIDIPTSFGPISMTLQITPTGQSATLTLTPPRRDPPQKILLHTEHFPKEVTNAKTKTKNKTFTTTLTFK